MSRKKSLPAAQKDDPQWYKDAIIYEVHVRAFHDSDGDGIGDFRGLTEKLEYLQELGVTAIWILPFFPSPLKDDGYDTSDYRDIHPHYGTMRDFRAFLRAAHARGLRVITELVLNHTSDQHPWFQRARHAKPGSSARDFYVWSNTHKLYEEARIIFQDFENSNWTWDDAAGAYYWHRFYSHQPDLNYDNPQVRRVMMQTVDYWFRQGVDGLRLDAVPYLYERSGTNCENLPETYDYLRELRAHIDEKFDDRMLLAEANQWPEDAVAYFGDDDMCHMAFHFPIMPRLFMAVYMEDRYPILDILEQTPDIPDKSQWALFLRNHDELTLEMVTDEERDMMYRVYARDPQMRVNLGIRRRLAPLMSNNRRMIELLNALLLSLPGTPVLYYGDEIGMGDNIYLGDRNAVRTPMQWSADRNAGFSRANPQQLYLPVNIDPGYHYETVNVEAQSANPHSLLWWTRRIIALRRRHKAFGRGSIEFLTPENRKVLCFVREYDGESILVIANLSKHVQYVELDLSAYPGLTPVELFGNTEFPQIGSRPYPITVSGHAFYWFSLASAQSDEMQHSAEDTVPQLLCPERWEDVFGAKLKPELEQLLPRHINTQSWFCGQKGRISKASIQEQLTVSNMTPQAYICLVHLEYSNGDEENYSLPLCFATGSRAQRLKREKPEALVSKLEIQKSGEKGYLFDALESRTFCLAMLENVPRSSSGRRRGPITISSTRALRSQVQDRSFNLHAPSARVDQNNTVVQFSDIFVLKVFRRIDSGTSLELEIGRYLKRKNFAQSPDIAGAIEYRRNRHQSPATLAVLLHYVPNQGTVWHYILDMLRSAFDQARTLPELNELEQPLSRHEFTAHVPERVQELFGPAIERFSTLGSLTAQLHSSLSSPDPERTDENAFQPENFTRLYQRSLYQGTRSRVGRVWPRLKKQYSKLTPLAQDAADWVLAHKSEVQNFYKQLTQIRLDGQRIRCHGDYHLGHILLQDQSFTIIDFEGDPRKTYGERRILRSPLRDIASLIRSMDYAAFAALKTYMDQGLCPESKRESLLCLGRQWRYWSSSAFLASYMDGMKGNPAVPSSHENFLMLLDVLLLDHAIMELAEDLDSRPDWALVPLAAIRSIITGTPCPMSKE